LAICNTPMPEFRQHRLGSIYAFVREFARTSSSVTKTAGASRVRLSVFPDQTALGIRQRPKYLQNQPTLRDYCVEGFGQPTRSDGVRAKGIDGFDQ
jgi:hypothetical protein